MDAIVRIHQIELENFKNVAHGIVKFQNAYKGDLFSQNADIIGIYGQNGSGKTSIVDAIQIIGALLSNQSMPSHTEDVITCGTDGMRISCIFSFDDENIKEVLSYDIVIKKIGFGVFLEKEHLRILPIDSEGTAWDEVQGEDIWNFRYNGRKLEPQNANIGMTVNDFIETQIIQELSKKQKKSFIFSRKGILFLGRRFKGQYDKYRRILLGLASFAERNLSVINNVHSGYINARMAQPFTFKLVEGDMTSKGAIAISVDGVAVITNEAYHLLEQLVQQLNGLLPQIVPECRLLLKKHGVQTTNDGKDGIRFELMSKREDKTFPLRCESDGIKKIISVLNALIQVYNEERACIVIDEFDAGIFEYLLGDIVHALSRGAKGQFIFTSHNLRPLEVLDETAVIFTTVNPNCRYIRIRNDGNQNNLRSNYYRSIHLGGQMESLYQSVNVYKLQREFRKAAVYKEKM